jgi:hypothetical protein
MCDYYNVKPEPHLRQLVKECEIIAYKGGDEQNSANTETSVGVTGRYMGHKIVIKTSKSECKSTGDAFIDNLTSKVYLLVDGEFRILSKHSLNKSDTDCFDLIVVRDNITKDQKDKIKSLSESSMKKCNGLHEIGWIDGINATTSDEDYQLHLCFKGNTLVNAYFSDNNTLHRGKRIINWTDNLGRILALYNLKIMEPYVPQIFIELLDKITLILNQVNYSNYGKDQLQGEGDPDSRRSEGCVIYGRRNKLEYSAGRHCNEASAKGQEGGAGRYQVVLSSRSAEVLRHKG